MIDDDDPTPEEAEHSANLAFCIWRGDAFFQAHASDDFKHDDERAIAFIICFAKECGYNIDRHSVEICWNMDNDTADRLLDYVTPSIRQSFEERYGSFKGRWR
jgi:hypothetical protein